MAVRSQPSESSLAKYAVAKSPGNDPYNGSTARDFCNSFWGEGEAGVNILFARLRGAARTTDDLRNFWKERCVHAVYMKCGVTLTAYYIRSLIEKEYATKLLELSRQVIGKDEMG